MSTSVDWQQALADLPLEQVPDCNACGSRGTSRDERWARLLNLRSPYAVRRCTHCGLRWLDPRPSADGYGRLYSDEMYFGGTSASPSNYARLVSTRHDYFNARLRALEVMLGPAPLKVLDFGAASGDFVAIARRRGHACDGVELSEDARRTAKSAYGIELLSGEEVGKLPTGGYDVVHMNHVLEHMPDPASHLRWCHDQLKPTGVVVIEVPQQFDNALDRLRRVLSSGGRNPRFDAYSLHHTYFFSPGNLAGLCRRAKLEVVRHRTFNPAATPLWPASLRNWILYGLLRPVDAIAAAGNIIEIVAAPVGRRLAC